MTLKVELPPALEKFAEDSVAEGRFASISDVVASGLRFLQAREEQRLAFVQSLKDAEEESERDGYVTLEEVMADIDAIIEASEPVHAD
jgi:putative addiction module CopG family antidote